MKIKGFVNFAKYILGSIVHLIYSIEKQIFFATGFRLPVLKIIWRYKAKKIQVELDEQRQKKEKQIYETMML